MRTSVTLRTIATALVVLAANSNGLRAQTPAPDTVGVRRAALDYTEGFYEGDTAKLARSVRSDVHKFGSYLLLGRFEGRWMITHVLWQSPPRKTS